MGLRFFVENAGSHVSLKILSAKTTTAWMEPCNSDLERGFESFVGVRSTKADEEVLAPSCPDCRVHRPDHSTPCFASRRPFHCDTVNKTRYAVVSVSESSMLITWGQISGTSPRLVGESEVRPCVGSLRFHM